MILQNPTFTLEGPATVRHFRRCRFGFAISIEQLNSEPRKGHQCENELVTELEVVIKGKLFPPPRESDSGSAGAGGTADAETHWPHLATGSSEKHKPLKPVTVVPEEKRWQMLHTYTHRHMTTLFDYNLELNVNHVYYVYAHFVPCD